MNISIITPKGQILSQTVDEVLIPTEKGQIGILPHHANLVTKILPGELILKSEKKEQSLAITAGFLEVHNDQISILADYAVRSEHIEIEKALEAKKRAEMALQKAKEQQSEKDLVLAEADLRRSILELDVVNRRKRKSSI